MNIVIPMAGKGQRFADVGHQLPKFLLEAHGKTLLEWSVDSLPLELAELTIFVMLKEHQDDFQMVDRITKLYGEKTPLDFVFLDKVTRGQAETVLSASNYIDPDSPLLIFNIDTAFKSETLKRNLLRSDVDGVLGCFESTEPRFSYAEIDDKGCITRVREKEVITTHALTGLYHFKTADLFLEVASESIRTCELTKGEFYIAPLYNKLISRSGRFILDHTSTHYILGTPLEYNRFCDESNVLEK